MNPLLLLLVSLLVLSASAQFTPLSDPSLTSYTSSVQLSFNATTSSAQFTLVPCEGVMVWRIGTTPGLDVTACATAPEDKMCRYEYRDNLVPGSVVYISVTNVAGFDAKFDFIASSSLTYFDSITPPTTTSFVSADVFYSTPSDVVAVLSWPSAYSPGTTYNNYSVYKFETSDPANLAPNLYFNTSCGVRNFMTQVDIVPTLSSNEVFSSPSIPINGSLYTFFTVVSDHVDPSVLVTYSSAYNGIWIVPNSALPFAPSTSSTTSNSPTVPTGNSASSTGRAPGGENPTTGVAATTSSGTSLHAMLTVLIGASLVVLGCMA